MTNIKKRLTVEQHMGTRTGEPAYVVIKAINTLTPQINDILSQERLQDEIDTGTIVTVVPIKS